MSGKIQINYEDCISSLRTYIADKFRQLLGKPALAAIHGLSWLKNIQFTMRTSESGLFLALTLGEVMHSSQTDSNRVSDTKMSNAMDSPPSGSFESELLEGHSLSESGALSRPARIIEDAVEPAEEGTEE